MNLKVFLTKAPSEKNAKTILAKFFSQATEKLRFAHCQINFLQLIRMVAVRFRKHMVWKKHWLGIMKKEWNKVVMGSVDDGRNSRQKSPDEVFIRQSIQKVPE